MELKSVKVKSKTHDRLTKHISAFGMSIDDVITKALDALEKK